MFSGDPSCSPPNISLPLSTDITKATKMKKSEDFVFFVNIAINCPIPSHVQVLYHEEMFSIDQGSGSFRNVNNRIGTTVGNVRTTINGKRFNYGYYFYKITGSIERHTGTTVSSFGYIEITSTTLVANISGANQVSQGFNKILTLDGSLSHDPDVGEGDYTGLDFTWLCRRENEIFPNNIAALPVVSAQSESPDLSGQDGGGCYGTGVGKLKPRDGFSYIVDLGVDKMKGDEDYVIKMAMRKRGQTVYAIHHLRIKEEIHLNIT